MSLAVLSFPDMPPEAHTFIAGIRMRNPQLGYRVAEPHFTLVFLIEDIEPQVLVNHAEQQLAGSHSFWFVMNQSIAVRDVLSANSHVFLLPEKGYKKIFEMHDKLYTGVIAPFLRDDIAFVPHITIGSSTDHEACEKVSREINEEGFFISGRINSVDVTRFENGVLESLKRIELLKGL